MENYFVINYRNMCNYIYYMQNAQNGKHKLAHTEGGDMHILNFWSFAINYFCLVE